MDVQSVLIDAYRGSHRGIREVMEAVQPEWLFEPAPSGLTVAYLLWHVIRDEDTVIQGDLLGQPQVWTTGAWAERLGVDTADQGTGFDAESVAKLRYSLTALGEYAEQVWQATARFLESADEERLGVEIWGRSTLTHLLDGSIGHNWVHVGEARAIMGLHGWRDAE